MVLNFTWFQRVNYNGGMDQDFYIVLGYDDEDGYAWWATCRVCGLEFPHETFTTPRRVINALDAHVHQEEVDYLAILRTSPSSDTVLRSLGLPAELL